MSYGLFLEYTGQGGLEQQWDKTYLQPALAAHPDVTFFAASDDYGATFGLIYPSSSPNVVSVGGTSLFLTSTNQWSSETGWADSGGGFSTTFAEPTYQENDGFDNSGFRTNPDVAAVADPATGVAVYDPYDLGPVTPWIGVGGTSVSTPIWAGMMSIADEGRVLARGRRWGRRRRLLLYGLARTAPGDFHAITQGNNGFPAGPGYNLVTGLGFPHANLLIPALASVAVQASIVTQPPPSVVAGDSFGILAAPVNSLGDTDYGYTGTATLAVASGPSGASFTPLTVPVSDGIAVFDGLSLGQLSGGTGYVFKVSMSHLSSTKVNPVNVVAPTTGVQNSYPLPIYSSAHNLYAAIQAADTNSYAINIITLSMSSLPYDASHGQLLIENNSIKTSSKSITIVGQGQASSVIDAAFANRLFEIIGMSSLRVTLDNLGIERGLAKDNGGLTGPAGALGGGVLIDGGTVALSNVELMKNAADGSSGAGGTNGHSATTNNPTGGAGGDGRNGSNAAGGGIYLSAGSLNLSHDVIQGNTAQGGAGGKGGDGGLGYSVYVTTTSFGFSTSVIGFVSGSGGPGGNGGAGGSADGGGLYVAGGTLSLSNDTFTGNLAAGGAGGAGGTGGRGVHWTKDGGSGGNGGSGGTGCGGALTSQAATCRPTTMTS